MITLLKSINEEDIKKFELIETQREYIKNKNISIDIIDYEAGNPKDTRSSEESYTGVLKKTTSKQQCAIGLKDNFAKLMYMLTKKNKPSNILELGTCCGFSSIYMSKGSPSSNIYTIEGDESVASIAKRNIQSLNCKNINQYIGRFQDVLPSLLEEIKEFDFVFIDGHHDEEATINYFNQIKPFLSKSAIIVFDDISWSKGMIKAWNIIKNDKIFNSYDDLDKIGICYLGNK